MTKDLNFPQELISRRELATRLNVSVQTISRLDREGRLPHVKFCQTYRYDWQKIKNEVIEVSAVTTY